MATRRTYTISTPLRKPHPAPHDTTTNIGVERPQQPGEIFGSYIWCADDANCIVRTIVSQRTTQHLVVFYLDEEHRLLAYTVLADGPQSRPMISKQELFQRALNTNASAIIVARYHPAGVALSVPVDAGILMQWREAGESLEIPIVDMVIVTENDFLSLKYGPQIYCR